MREIELLVETYLAAERELVAAVYAAGGAVPLPDGRTVSVGRAEFDAAARPAPQARMGDGSEECADAAAAMIIPGQDAHR
jgi:hypothetical protein